jgi:putative peptidoglycan lipid II flippase
VARVTVSALVGIGLMLVLDDVPLTQLSWLSEESGFRLGAVGLALGSSVGAIVELVLLGRALRRQELDFGLPVSNALRHLIVAGAATVPALTVWWMAARMPFAAAGPLVVGCYAATYLLMAWIVGFEEARRLIPTRSRRDRSGD